MILKKDMVIQIQRNAEDLGQEQKLESCCGPGTVQVN